MSRRWVLLPLSLQIIGTVMMFSHFDSIAADRVDLPGGFRLGSSLNEAKRHAAATGWQLVAMPPELSGQWFVKEANIGIYVCDDAVASVTQSSEGDLDDFAQLVFDLQMMRGEPKMQTASFMAGATRISNIDARFAEVDGVGVAVQLNSTAGRLTISTNYFSDTCADPRRER